MKKIGLLLVLLFLIMNFSQAQETIHLWGDATPGAIDNPAYEAKSNSTIETEKTSHITQTMLDIYPADKKTANGTAVIVCPGGGYSHLAIDHEGKQIAEWFNSIGISAFVLKYRLPSDDIMKNKTIGPLQDAQKAIRYVRRNCKKWKVDPKKIGILGFSAGGHLASTASTHYNDKVYEPIDNTSARPDFSLLIYPVISMEIGTTHMGSRENLLGKKPSQDLVEFYSNEKQVNDNTPPAFMVHAMNDPAVPVQNSINYALALKKHSIPCELHIYQSGGHGFGMGKTTNTECTWPKACEKWLQMNGLL